jgi:hypothetical protein
VSGMDDKTLKALEDLNKTAAAISEHFNVPIEIVNKYLCEVIEERNKKGNA